MAKQAAYEIQINGIKESISAVESLNKQLDALEQRMDKLASKNINVSTSGGDGGARVSALDEEAKMLQQIEQLHQKVAASEKEQYQELLHAKEELKEYQTIAKSLAAQDNLKSGINDLNTMQGMKAQLHDLKAAMQTVDINGDQFKQWAAEANELTQKLKEAEASYGTFSRNVGNYSNGVAEGISKYKVQIGDTVREFDSAKQAAKELSNELLNLPKGAEGAQDLRKAIQSIKSDIKDLAASSNAMDNLLDTMQSFTAIASVGQGISSLFGIDNNAIDQSIQKLVALQNVMQGLEQLNQQMNTGEGIMGWISKGNDAIDSLAAKITGASKAQKTLNTETTAGATAAKGLAAAETAQAAATTTATVATKALSLALKSIGIGLVISLVSTLVTYWKDIYQWFVDTVPALRNLSTWFDRIRAIASGVGTAIINYMVQPLATLVKTIQAVINGNFSEIPKIISNGIKKTFDVAGNYQKGYHKEIERQQRVHNNKVKEEQRRANEEQLKDEEAKYGTSHRRTQEYYRKQMALIDQSTKEGKEKYKEYQRALWADERAEREEAAKNASKNAKQAEANAKKNAEQLEQAQEKLTSLKIALMRDGLKKELAELDAENEKELAAIEKNGVMVDELRLKQQELYNKKRAELIKKSDKEIEDAVRESTLAVEKSGVEQLEFQNKLLSYSTHQYVKLVDSFELSEKIKLIPEQEYNKLEDAIGAYKRLINLTEELSKIPIGGNNKKIVKEIEDLTSQAQIEFGQLWNLLDKYGVDVFEKLLGGDENDVLSTSLAQTIAAIDKYYKTVGNEMLQNLEALKQQRLKVLKEEEANEYAEALTQRDNNYQVLPDLNDPHYQEILENNRKVLIAYEVKCLEIETEYNNKNNKVQEEYLLDVSALYDRYYQDAISKFQDFQEGLNRIASRQPIRNNWQIVNMSETRRQLREAYAAALAAKQSIAQQLSQLESDFREGIITPAVYKATKKNLQAIEESVDENAGKIIQDIKDVPADFAQSLQQYTQALGNAASTLMSSFGDLYNYNIQKELDALDKMNEALNDKLEEQKDIEERHKSEIESIEDELANSRGDRREQLIDQLNAEMQARREAAAEQKRIEAEMARNKRKQDELEKKQARAQYKRDLAQILISGAMAATNGFATKPFLPTGLAMGALATTLTAAQYIIAKKQKPYAKGGQLDGGVIKGKRHYAGGISVLGGRANVEGGEYITNRISTANNVALLDFVNSKKHKINLSELIDFYQSPKALKSSSKRVFADGGQLPTMPNIDLGDIMTDVAIVRDDRPVVVSVVDINRKQDDVRRVQILSGLNPR